jgi:hypothetical protein
MIHWVVYTVGLRDLECGRAEIALYGVKRSRDFCVLGLVLGGLVGGGRVELISHQLKHCEPRSPPHTPLKAQ